MYVFMHVYVCMQAIHPSIFMFLWQDWMQRLLYDKLNLKNQKMWLKILKIDTFPLHVVSDSTENTVIGELMGF